MEFLSLNTATESALCAESTKSGTPVSQRVSVLKTTNNPQQLENATPKDLDDYFDFLLTPQSQSYMHSILGTNKVFLGRSDATGTTPETINVIVPGFKVGVKEEEYVSLPFIQRHSNAVKVTTLKDAKGLPPISNPATDSYLKWLAPKLHESVLMWNMLNGLQPWEQSGTGMNLPLQMPLLINHHNLTLGDLYVARLKPHAKTVIESEGKTDLIFNPDGIANMRKMASYLPSLKQEAGLLTYDTKSKRVQFHAPSEVTAVIHKTALREFAPHLTHFLGQALPLHSKALPPEELINRKPNFSKRVSTHTLELF